MTLTNRHENVSRRLRLDLRSGQSLLIRGGSAGGVSNRVLACWIYCRVMDNPYLRLTAEFNRGRLRTLLSSGQAVVMHRLAIMSKDGDWILREDEEAVAHLIGVLGAKGARYRFGAPLDLRWMTGGWSSHFQFIENGLRIRTDFVSRPPRISEAELGSLWAAAESSGDEVIGLEPLAAAPHEDEP